METIFLLGVVQSAFLALILLSKKNKMLVDKILFIWLLFIGLHLFSHYLKVAGLMTNYPLFHAVSLCFAMLEGVFIFIYAKTITSKVQKLRKWDFFHAIPYILFTSILLYAVFSENVLTTEERITYLENNPTVLIFIIATLNVFLGPLYLIFSFLLLRKHKRNISTNFSYTEDIDLKWLFYIVCIMGGVWFVVVLADVLAPVIDSTLAGNLIYLAVTLSVFFIGYFGIKQQVIYTNKPAPNGNLSTTQISEEPTEAMGNRYQKSGLKKEESLEYVVKLRKYMEEEKPYLNGKLTLKDTASYLDMSVNHLSQVINEQLGVNFFDFVNEYRVEEVKRLLADPAYKQYTLLAVAYDSGFNSKSSFNNVFKKFTGTTPSNYTRS